MKAILHTQFGPPDELQLVEVEKPIPKDNELLIKVRATTVTTSDCNLRNLTFAPKWARIPFRISLGVFKPRKQRLGVEMAGEVEAVGKDVQRFDVGDHIFGTPEPQLGTHAEYITAAEDRAITKKTAEITWAEAAALTLAGNTALVFIRDVGRVQSGQKILINGASGGIGTFAVQLAKYYGAEVTGVCGSSNVELVESLGADRVIDYTKEDFTLQKEEYDIIYDVVNKISFSRCKGSLKPKGLYLAGAGQELFQMIWTSLVGGRKIKTADAVSSVENLDFLKQLIQSGDLKVVIDRSYSLENIVEAFKYVETGHKRGSVVINVSIDHE